MTDPAANLRALMAGTGWVFSNPDTGEEYAPQHPVESGEVPDASDIRRSTLQEDTLHTVYQSEWGRANAAESERDKLRGRVAELEEEARVFDEDHADRNRMVDRIADLIGLPHDQELDTTAFELWFSANVPSALTSGGGAEG